VQCVAYHLTYCAYCSARAAGKALMLVCCRAHCRLTIRLLLHFAITVEAYQLPTQPQCHALTGTAITTTTRAPSLTTSQSHTTQQVTFEPQLSGRTAWRCPALRVEISAALWLVDRTGLGLDFKLGRVGRVARPVAPHSAAPPASTLQVRSTMKAY
jgi:hypothetical protein